MEITIKLDGKNISIWFASVEAKHRPNGKGFFDEYYEFECLDYYEDQVPFTEEELAAYLNEFHLEEIEAFIAEERMGEGVQDTCAYEQLEERF